jgi:hypothetical protein
MRNLPWWIARPDFGRDWDRRGAMAYFVTGLDRDLLFRPDDANMSIARLERSRRAVHWFVLFRGWL